MSISVEDRLAIHELLALYGHLLDDDRWDDLHRVFAEEFTFDGTQFGFGVMRSVDELKANWAGNEHHSSLQHHTTNVVVTEDSHGTKIEGNAAVIPLIARYYSTGKAEVGVATSRVGFQVVYQ